MKPLSRMTSNELWALDSSVIRGLLIKLGICPAIRRPSIYISKTNQWAYSWFNLVLENRYKLESYWELQTAADERQER